MTVVCVVMTVLLTVVSVFADNIVPNGDFEDGINGFGVCYSSRNDTVMPAIYATDFAYQGGGALELVPGATLTEIVSTSPVSSGFAYQGVYNKNVLSAEAGFEYSISANVYPAAKNVTMRIIVVKDSKAVAVSDAFLMEAEQWGNATFKWSPDTDMKNLKIRLAFYSIEFGKSIFLDDFSCSKAVISNKSWSAQSDETVTYADSSIAFATVGGKDGGIVCYTNGGQYLKSGKYALVGEATTDYEKSYFSVSCADSHEDFLLEQNKYTGFVLPFEVTDSGEYVFKINAISDSTANITLKGVKIVNEEEFVSISEINNKIVISGKLRTGNENKTITIDVNNVGTYTATTDGAGNYSYSLSYPEFDDPQMIINAEVSGIKSYSDMGGILSASYCLNNPDYAKTIAEKISDKGAAEIKTVLTTEVLDNLGISYEPIMWTATLDDICVYLENKSINSKNLIDEITTGAVLSSLTNKKQVLTDMVNEFGDLLKVKEIPAYSKIYVKTEDKSAFNSIFTQSSAKLNSLDKFKYAFTEAMVKYEMTSKANYSQKIRLLKDYAKELNISFKEYDKLSSLDQREAATQLTEYIAGITDYSLIQSKLDYIVKHIDDEPISGPMGGGGGGGGGAPSAPVKSPVTTDDISVSETQPAPKKYEFIDLSEFEWAQEAIYALTDSGVISKPDDKKFNPSDNVTRAELAKMAAVMFKVEEYTGNEIIFADVTPDDWYYKYVMALYKAGAVSGVSETLFDSNASITRQDICVILSKLIQSEEQGDTSIFSDIDTADDYAQPAIAIMQKTGAISGYEDGTFRPHSFATRAEIAKILYAVSK